GSACRVLPSPRELRRGPGWTRPRPKRPATTVTNDENREASYGRPLAGPGSTPTPTSATTATVARKPVTVPTIRAAKGGEPLVMVTAYDATFARILDEAGADLLLVGDSLGMVVQGN